MRYLQHELHAVGPFADRTIDLEALPGPLVAVCGANGAGKSTLLETLFGAVFRTTPTRGSLIDLATARDSYVETLFEHDGKRYRIRQLIDAVSRKGVAVLTDGAGVALVESTKVSAVDRFIAEHLPPPGVLLVTTIAAQQSQGFIDEDPAARKTLLLRMLGVERLEDLAARARKKASETSGEFNVAADRVSTERARGLSVEEAKSKIALLTNRAETATVRVTEERQRLDELKERSRLADVRARHRREALLLQTQARERLREARDKLADVEERVANNEKILAQGDDIRAAETELERMEGRLRVLGEELSKHWAESKANTAARVEAERRRAEVDARLQRCVAALSNEAAVRDAVRRLPDLRGKLDTGRQVVRDFQGRLDEARDRAAGDRIGGLRQGLAAIRDSHSSIDAARETAGSTLAADDERANAPDALAALEQARDRAVDDVDTVERECRRLGELAAGEQALAGYADERARATKMLEEIDAELEATALARLDLERTLTDKAAERKAYLDERKPELDKLARLAKPLAIAETRLEELRPQAIELGASVAKLAGELDAIEIPDEVVGVEWSEDALRAAEGEERAAASALAVAEAAVAEAEKSETRIADLAKRASDLGVELADWKKLATDLGKDGLQATVIDAALPELVAMTNSLLHASFGPRFTVDVRSQTLDARGKKTLETLEIHVIDSENGRESKAETYSGGERAIIAEGLSLALTTLASRELGVVRPTLIRDEAGAALDPENGQAWIAMLRQACAMMGADKLLFVSHSAELAALADSRIEL